eukprot:CAMPEP_0172772230 /NCGR_PEP_ID=MMETSP1074-20121228/191979_1 /TAXON_ID=2916 /ORGANISM="Ceratium fusus, Strain PA161109" /LENGTH=153 /DNA_ID=CAMNT_0013608299 /DNA_START=519 /DNA_END=976 /DNA_ORIENTATION=+
MDRFDHDIHGSFTQHWDPESVADADECLLPKGGWRRSMLAEGDNDPIGMNRHIPPERFQNPFVNQILPVPGASANPHNIFERALSKLARQSWKDCPSQHTTPCARCVIIAQMRDSVSPGKAPDFFLSNSRQRSPDCHTLNDGLGFHHWHPKQT